MSIKWENSVTAVNEYQSAHGINSKATVMVKRSGTSSTCWKNCDIYIGRGQYGHHNMPYVSINYETDYDCMHTEMVYDGDMLTIYTKDAVIDVMPYVTEDEEDERCPA